jgi:quinol monooxygenase YgiN
VITLVAHVRVQPQHAEAYMAVIAEMTALTNANEPGMVYYNFSRSVDDPNLFLVLEIYADHAAFEAHWATDYIWPSIDKTRPLMEGGSIDIKQYVSPGTEPVQLGRMKRGPPR